MTGHVTEDLIVAVCDAGALGSLPATLLSPDALSDAIAAIQARTSGAFAVNFLAHSLPQRDARKEADWSARLKPMQSSFGPLDHSPGGGPIPSFGEGACRVLERTRPAAVSFHIGLPDTPLIKRLKDAGIAILATATTPSEAKWLEEQGCDAIVAQGSEAGGHRGTFAADHGASQPLHILIRQILETAKLPVIAAGGIGDAKGVEAALALGACAVQVGTGFMFCPETRVPPPYRAALEQAHGGDTVVTRAFTGQPARVIGNRFTETTAAYETEAPAFPYAAAIAAPLIAASYAAGSSDLVPLWAGEAVGLGKEMSARDLIEMLTSGSDR